MKNLAKYIGLLGIIISPTVAYSYSDPINISGITGYIFTPSAYIQSDNSITLGATTTNEFKNTFISSVIFPGLETGINYDMDNNNNKNFNIKYQFLPETKNLPAIGFGANINGNSAFEGTYAVISKYINIPIPQTITIGYGTGFYNGFFVGNELLIHPKLTLITEYLEPDKKELNNLKIKPAIHTNFGLKIMPLKNFQITLYYNFGKESGININYSINF